MDLHLSEKTALVTGASAGIGRAIARGLAREGAKVALTARRIGLLTELAEEMAADGAAPAVLLESDLAEDFAPEHLVAEAARRLGSVDILVNAAGGSRPVAIDASHETWDEGMTLNFFRVREITHAAIPGMIARNWGRVINITGTSEPRGINVANAAKAAVHAWAKGLSREVAGFGITVNSIQPGYVLSEQMRRMYPTDQLRREVAGRDVPLGRFGSAEELADVAVFLASPRASYVTGTAVHVDGGMSRFAF